MSTFDGKKEYTAINELVKSGNHDQEIINSIQLPWNYFIVQRHASTTHESTPCFPLFEVIKKSSIHPSNIVVKSTRLSRIPEVGDFIILEPSHTGIFIFKNYYILDLYNNHDNTFIFFDFTDDQKDRGECAVKRSQKPGPGRPKTGRKSTGRPPKTKTHNPPDDNRIHTIVADTAEFESVENQPNTTGTPDPLIP